MIILTTLNTQTISVIPREYNGSEIVITIRDDSTNVETEYIGLNATVIDGNYLEFNLTFSPILVENHFYDMKVSLDGKTIYKDRIFCTDQSIDQLTKNDYYQLNKDVFTFYNGFDNTYTVR